MADEVLAFEHAIVIQNDLKSILETRTGLKMFTDSKRLFHVISRFSHTTKKRLNIKNTTAR